MEDTKPDLSDSNKGYWEVISISDDSEDDTDIKPTLTPTQAASATRSSSDMPQVGSVWPSMTSLLHASHRAANESGYKWKMLSRATNDRRVLGCGRNSANNLSNPICPVRLDIERVEEVDGTWKVTRYFHKHNHAPLAYEVEDWKKGNDLHDLFYREKRRQINRLREREEAGEDIPRKGKLSDHDLYSNFFPVASSSSTTRVTRSSTLVSAKLESATATSLSPQPQPTPNESSSPDTISLSSLKNVIYSINPILIPLAEPFHQQGINSRATLLYFLHWPEKVLEMVEVNQPILKKVMILETKRVRQKLESLVTQD